MSNKTKNHPKGGSSITALKDIQDISFIVEVKKSTLSNKAAKALEI